MIIKEAQRGPSVIMQETNRGPSLIMQDYDREETGGSFGDGTVDTQGPSVLKVEGTHRGP